MSKRKPNPEPAPEANPLGPIVQPPSVFMGTAEHPEWRLFVYNGLVRMQNEFVLRGGPENYRCLLAAVKDAVVWGDERKMLDARDGILDVVVPWMRRYLKRTETADCEAAPGARDAAKAADEAKTLEDWFNLDGPSEGGVR